MSTIAVAGGSRVRTVPFPRRTTIDEHEVSAALRVLHSGELSAFFGSAGPFFDGGKEVLAFERSFADQAGARHAVTFNSWTSGLTAAIGSLGLEPGDEMLCAPYTMSASATCALFYGAVPVFVDIDPATFCINPDRIEQLITPRTRAIMVVHLFGLPADLGPILSIAERHGLRVIEDAAQAPLATYRGAPVGSIGDLGGFSLNYHKHIHTGEGGIVTTNDAALARRCSLIRNHGENVVTEDEPDLATSFGGNFRLTELQAAIGMAQLDRLPALVKQRRELAGHLAERLEGHPSLTVPTQPGDREHSYYVFPLLYDESVIGVSREAFIAAVNAELPEAATWDEVPLAGGYVRPLHLNPVYPAAAQLRGRPTETALSSYRQGACPVAEQMHATDLLLTPLVREPLTPADLDDLAAALWKVAEHASEIPRE